MHIGVIIVLALLAVAVISTLSQSPQSNASGKASGKPDVFSADLVGRNAAVLCSKGDPLKNGGIYRVVSPNRIAWYPSVPIAESWDPNWRAAVTVDCTGAVAAPTMQQK